MRTFLVIATLAAAAALRSAGCELGERVLAFFPDNGCEPEEPQCWRNATVADGPGRDDAFVTVVEHPREAGPRAFQRLHGSYARRVRDGTRCFPVYARSEHTMCRSDACDHFEDSIHDVVGAVITVAGRSGEKRTITCEEAGARLQGRACSGPMHEYCRRTCDRLERDLRTGPQRCFSPKKTLPLLKRFARWRWYSQAMQDSALHLLLLRPYGAVPLSTGVRAPRFFVEFGYSTHFFSNSEYLRQLGWEGVRFDLNYSQPSAFLFAEEVTAKSIVEVFKRHNVPEEPDFVSIDIDSCDIWVFLALVDSTSPFQPRVVQIEYNRHYAFDEVVALDCSSGGPPWMSGSGWPIKEFPPVTAETYGASLRAIAHAADARGYTVVWVERCYDVFLVRKDLVCPGDELPFGIEHFQDFVAIKGAQKCGDGYEYFARAVGDNYRTQWVKHFQVT